MVAFEWEDRGYPKLRWPVHFDWSFGGKDIGKCGSLAAVLIRKNPCHFYEGDDFPYEPRTRTINKTFKAEQRTPGFLVAPPKQTTGPNPPWTEVIM